MDSSRAEMALFLIKSGYTAKEIVKACGYSNISCVFNLAKKHGLKVAKANNHKHDLMRAYKAAGHSMAEVAEKFNVSKGTAQNICKGIEPQKGVAFSKASKYHNCPVCGKPTNKPKFCSEECRKKANYTIQNVRRRAKVHGAMVDSDITLHDLFIRDNGRCHICGGVCDWNNYEYTNGRFIAGKNYPTIDHVRPLAKGGAHSWDNIKLAHFGCNSAKGARWDG